MASGGKGGVVYACCVKADIEADRITSAFTQHA